MARNYFSHAGGAQRYAGGRPYNHPLFAERIRQAVCPSGKVKSALDVACGTGNSARALTAIAEDVVGVDASFEMLRHAPRPIPYVQAAAESLPFAIGSFDLLTVGRALHWFDRTRFFAEAARVLKPGGWVALYGDRFLHEMSGNPDYGQWHRDQYVTRYPRVLHDGTAVTAEAARNHGLELTTEDRFEHTVDLSCDELVRYLLTHSNIIAAEIAGEDVGSISLWIAESIRPFFRDKRGAFRYDCHLDLLRRI